MMLIMPNLIIRFNTKQNPGRYFKENDKLILKFIWDFTGPRKDFKNNDKEAQNWRS